MASSFALNLSRAISRANANIDKAIQKVAQNVFAEVIDKTPVDTGRARANWQCENGSIPTGDLDDFDKSGGKSKEKMKTIVSQARAGGVIYLVNNLPYIGVLEYGRASGKPGSIQAPNGMVRITVAEHQSHVNNALGAN